MSPDEEDLILQRLEQRGVTARSLAADTDARQRVGEVESFLLGGLDSVSLGWADELAGIGNPKLKTRLRDRYDLAREQQGGAFFAGGMGGAFVPGLGLLGLAGKVAKLSGRAANAGRAVTSASSLAQKARYGAGAGAALGGVYGAGSAKPMDLDQPASADPNAFSRAISGLGGATGGAAIGAAFPLLGAGMMQAGKAAYMPVRAIRELATNKPDIARAEAALFTRINQDLGPEARRALIAADARARGKSEAEVEALLAKDSGHSAADELQIRYRKSRSLGGSNPALLDVGDENVSRFVEYAGALPGPGRNIVKNEVQRRTQGQAQAVEKWIERKTGGTDLRQVLVSIEDEQRRVAGPLYRKLDNVFLDPAVRIRTRPRYKGDEGEMRSLGDLLARPSMRRAAQRAQTLAAEFGEDLSQLGLREGGELTRADGKISLSLMNWLKMGLDAEIHLAKKNPSANIDQLELAAMEKTRAQLVNVLDGQMGAIGRPGEYARARAAWAGPARLREAAEMGAKVFEPEGGHMTFVDEMERLLYPQIDDGAGGLLQLTNQAERHAAMAGLRDALLTKAGNARDGADLYKTLLGNKNVRQRIALVFGPLTKKGLPGPQARRFFDQVGKEAERLIKIRQVYSRTGSQTQPRAMEAEANDEMLAEALVNVMTGQSPVAAGLGVARSALRPFFSGSPLTPREAQHVVEQGLTPLSAQSGQPLDLALRLRAWQALQKAPTPYQGLGALATSRAALANL